MTTTAEKLTIQFYQWERIGRGWIYAGAPVDLEPPFTPFFGHFPHALPAIYDDGARHTLLSSIASLFKQKQVTYPAPQYPEVSYDPYQFQDTAPVITFRLHIPKEFRGSMNETISFLVMLSYCTSPVSVEYIATHERITLQIGCRERYATYLKGQLKTYFPEVNVSDAIIELTDFIEEEEKAIALTDFGLRDEFMRPLAQSAGSSIDSLTGVFSILDHLEKDERVIVQILFNGVVNQWEHSILRSVSDNKHGDFFKDAPEMLPMTKDKISAPLFAVTLRLLTQATVPHDAMQLLNKLCFAITQASHAPGNCLIPLPDEAYSIDQRVIDIAFRESHRVGMLLNAKELATFVHIPSVQTKKLFGKQRRTKAAPRITEGHPAILGTNEHDGSIVEVSVSTEQRLKHTHIIGATGTGKSTLLLSMIIQDIEQSNGVAVLDPHGDLIENVLSYIPENRIKDVIIIDPADNEHPVGFNILQAHSDIEKEILSSDLVASFKRNSTSWGDQMNSVFGNALIAFLESSKGGTLADLRRFLIEKSFREDFLKTVSDPSICYYWQKEYSLLKTNSVGPILTRLDTFLRPKLIRNMVCQQKALNFETILDKQKILLVKLSQGLIGVENSYLLGSFVVSKIHQAALARQARQVRNNFFFYIDEFQHFITPSMAGILSGARKYHLGLILAHQDMQQLQKYDSEIASSVIANAGTRICFRVGETDAKKLADGFSYFEAQDLQNLGKGEAIVRIEKPEYDFSLDTKPLDASQNFTEIQKRIITYSRQHYATSKKTVEEELARSMQIAYEERKEEPIQQKAKEKEEIPKKPSRGETIQQEKPIQPPAQIPPQEVETVIKKKEETQHRYLQTLIKRMAESRGYKATIEKLTSDGGGKVDVLLEKDNKTIACEVSVTTDPAWEIHNIQKCLSAGYDVIISCLTDKKAAALLQKKIQESFSKEQVERIKVFEPEGLFSYLDTAMATKPSPITETIFKGYRVKVNYDSVTDEEMKRKRESVAKIVVDSLKKMKK